MKTTEEYFLEFYNEVRYQIEQGAKANFTRANQIWAEYEASQSTQSDEISTLRAQLAEAREALELISYYKNYSTDGEVKTGYGVMHVSDFANRVLKNIR